MIVYRLTLPKYANDLSGGAALYGGRWNSVGNFVLYTAQTSSLSILEHLVQITGAASTKYVLSEINIPEISIAGLNTPLSDGWQSSEVETSRIGDKWVKEDSTPILRVPSIINPLEHNLLINLNHPELKLEIVTQEWFVYDQRLVRNQVINLLLQIHRTKTGIIRRLD